jgi:hypothetical protein
MNPSEILCRHPPAALLFVSSNAQLVNACNWPESYQTHFIYQSKTSTKRHSSKLHLIVKSHGPNDVLDERLGINVSAG